MDQKNITGGLRNMSEIQIIILKLIRVIGGEEYNVRVRKTSPDTCKLARKCR